MVLDPVLSFHLMAEKTSEDCIDTDIDSLSL